MKVIMTATGQVRDVADGHARNLLFPRKMAIPATSGALEEAAKKQLSFDSQQAELLGSQQVVVEKLKNITLKLSVKANDTGTLFAAVTNSSISNALSEQYKLDVKPDYILSDPIKHVGDYIAEISIPEQAIVKINVSVTENKA